MSSWTSLVSYLAVLLLLVLTCLSWSRLLGKVGRGLIITILLLYTALLCPLHLVGGSLTPRQFLAVILDLKFLVDTGHYAPGYSHLRFAEVKTGMKQTEILELLGEPEFHYTLSSGAEVWIYGRDAYQTSVYVDARLFFDQRRVVVRKIWQVELG